FVRVRSWPDIEWGIVASWVVAPGEGPLRLAHRLLASTAPRLHVLLGPLDHAGARTLRLPAGVLPPRESAPALLVRLASRPRLSAVTAKPPTFAPAPDAPDSLADSLC